MGKGTQALLAVLFLDNVLMHSLASHAVGLPYIGIRCLFLVGVLAEGDDFSAEVQCPFYVPIDL